MNPTQWAESEEGRSTLDHLSTWLTRQGVSDRDVHGLIDRIDQFHSDACRMRGSLAAVGVSARKDLSGGVEIRLHVLWPEDIAGPRERSALVSKISAQVGAIAAKLDSSVLAVRVDFVDEIGQESNAHFLGLLGMTTQEEAAAARLVRELSQIDSRLQTTLRKE